ncbi:non-canonical purine NTP pyrophosphatase [Candidatus Uhrbacteria bacterium]|nr:non-canonical purine NTP pyrophosphatase [Candidatus Uhrbacteria bacterium]
MDLLLATSNPGKITELRELLAELSVTLQTLADFADIPDCPENEPTFEENAIVKAKYYAERTGLPTLADDGGIEIDTLDGWPGVHSRRLFGDGRRATDEEMITEVLRRMEGIPRERRGCQMRSVVAFAASGGTICTGEGIDRGVIEEKASAYRIPGFPFRSIFFHPGEGMTTAEAVERGARMADVMTHRRNAIAQLLPALTGWIAAQDSSHK